MTPEDRQHAILELLDQRGACTYQELIEVLAVSNMTVRRDVDKLAHKGALVKTLGGAQKANAPAEFYESVLSGRLSAQHEEKRAIAVQALKLITAHNTIFLDGGTTCLALAKLLARQATPITVVTNSALICLEAGRDNGNTIVCLGGQYDPTSSSFVGPTAEDEAKKCFVDIAFISTKGFIPTEGTFESSVALFRIKQIIVEQATQSVLLVDHSKFGKRSLRKVLDIAQINTVITDGHAPQDDLARLVERGLTTHVDPTIDSTKLEVCVDAS